MRGLTKVHSDPSPHSLQGLSGTFKHTKSQAKSSFASGTVSACLKSSAGFQPERYLGSPFLFSPKYIFFDKLAKASSSLKGSEHFSRTGIHPAPYEFIN